MSNVGYGNHDGAGSEPDRPGEGPSPAGGPSGAPGAGADKHPQPRSSATERDSAPKDGTDPAASQADRGAVATPGDGAGASGPQGDEVDPGAG